jgi:hypothetical protein
MGCAQSRIENEESVSRCKERKNLIKDAVIARNAFSAGHSGYAVGLKNTGAALSDYGHGEAEDPHQHQAPADPTASQPPPPPPPPPMENLPPPPPLPNFSPSPSPIKRATSMPAMPMKPRKARAIAIAEEEEDDDVVEGEEDEEEDNEGNVGMEEKNGIIAKGGTRNGVGEVNPPQTPDMKAVPPPMPESKMAWDYFFMVEQEEGMAPGPSLGENVEAENVSEGLAFGGQPKNVEPNGVDFGDAVEPKTPEKQIEHAKTAPPEMRRVAKAVGSVSLMKILGELDDHFLKAYQSALEVSKMLEATRLHYHSNFADNRGNSLLFLMVNNKFQSFWSAKKLRIIHLGCFVCDSLCCVSYSRFFCHTKLINC